MSNKIVDKRDLVMNQAEEILLNMLKNHIDNELCAYAYFELTLGAGIEEYRINRIKEEMLTLDGTFKAKKYNPKSGKNVHYSMDDVLNLLVYFLGVIIRERALEDRVDEIIEKYGNTTYIRGIEYCLKEALFGIEAKDSDKHYNDFKKMIEEYILS